MNQRNSTCVIHINTRRQQPFASHCCDGTCEQGRSCPQVIERVSMFAGKPAFDYEADLSHEDWLWRRRQLLYVLAANFIALGSMGLLLYWAANQS